MPSLLWLDAVCLQSFKDGALARQEQSPVNKMLTKRAHIKQ